LKRNKKRSASLRNQLPRMFLCLHFRSKNFHLMHQCGHSRKT